MARKKAYIEDEVIEKAMNLFWQKGYEATSVRMLEQAMGINQFSIYSSFGNKQGVFRASMKCYTDKLQQIVNKLKAAEGKGAIKTYFYDFKQFAKETIGPHGCLINNTISELGAATPPETMHEMMSFIKELTALFMEKLKEDTDADEATLVKTANYLIISLQGMTLASKVADDEQLDSFIEMTFTNI